MERVERETPHKENLYFGQVPAHMSHARGSTGAHGGADRHRKAVDGEVGHGEGDHEQRRAIFPQFWISHEYSDRQ